MALLRQHKIVGALPTALEADALYWVRVGAGFDVYVTNGSGAVVAYRANYQPQHDNLSALAALAGAADQVPYFTGDGALALAGFTATGRGLAGAASVGAARAALGVDYVRGSGSTGEYNRYDNGTFEFWRSIALTATANTEISGTYTSPVQLNQNYRALIVCSIAAVSNDNSYELLKLSCDFVSGTQYEVRARFSVSQTYYVSLYGIGRWN